MNDRNDITTSTDYRPVESLITEQQRVINVTMTQNQLNQLYNVLEEVLDPSQREGFYGGFTNYVDQNQHGYRETIQRVHDALRPYKTNSDIIYY